MRPDVERWSRRRWSHAHDWPVPALVAAKGTTRVSVVLPALDEESTVGDIVARIRRELVEVSHPLVDEIVVMDSGSRDATATVAARAGARVVERADVLPEFPVLPGKGEVLWRSLAATDGDVVVFVDADLEDFSASVVTGLLGPVLTDRSICLVKGAFDRPWRVGDDVRPTGGGRVTELVARPLLNLCWPELAGVAQPLVGEYAARRGLLEQLAFPTGYGVELAILVDTLALAGLDAIAQVDLGVRLHAHQDDAALGRMAAEIWQTALRRLGADAAIRGAALTQFDRADGELVPRTHDVSSVERPPLVQVPGYRRAYAPRAAS
ncbi:MAG TPA: glucosyl-3-phosphoglycerate synthase [Actinomycetes bacterium]|nr:glucosyl-3-phosphoglycerate synthase [Actinomycetes bacterium]